MSWDDIDDMLFLTESQREVIGLLTAHFNVNEVDAKDIVKRYRPAFKLWKPEHDLYYFAFRIYQDVKSNIPVDSFVEYLKGMDLIVETLAEGMKLPQQQKKEHEFCQVCGMPKYRDESCTFC